MTLVSAVEDFCTRYGFEKTYWIGYSGGLDSHVLLSICHTLQAKYPLKLRAIHINHGLNANAKLWSKHCAHVCATLNIDYIERSIAINPCNGQSLEAQARAKRYALFADYLGEGDLLLTAHQQDDQAETMLMQLFRGAGPKGLAAMPMAKSFGRGFHLRPLLAVSRAQIERYAHEQQLKWIDDESNRNSKFTRNFIRHEILPMLKERWPTVATTIARAALHCAEAQSLLDEFAERLMTNVAGSKSNTLSVTKLLQLNNEKQKLVVRAFIRALSFPVPDLKKLETILHDVLSADQDKMPCVKWADVEMRRYRDDIYLMRQLATHDVNQVFKWDLMQQLQIPHVGILFAISHEPHQGNDTLALRADIQSVAVRFRRGGESAFVTGRGKHTLKNLFQEWGVPPWERERIPLIFINEKLISVLGHFVDPAYAAAQGERRITLSLEKNPPSNEGELEEDYWIG